MSDLLSKSKYNYPRERHLYQFLSKDSGQSQDLAEVNTNVDGTTPVKFFIKPPSGEIWVLSRMMCFMQDTGSFRAEGYGAELSALTIGMKCYLNKSGDTSDNIITSLPVKTNGDWAKYNYDAELKSWGAGDNVLVGRWTFAKSGLPLSLDGDEGEEFGVIVSDDLTFLVSQTFNIQGFKISKG